jgi:hypothetical protein
MANIAIANKSEILEDAKSRIMQGHTLAQIALDHGIGLRTLETWLHKLGEEYVELRQAWVDSLLMDAGQEIEDSLAPVILENGDYLIDRKGEIVKAVDKERVVRAREMWKRAAWYAERRDRERYGQQVANINIINGISLTDALQGEAGLLLENITDVKQERK